MRQKMLDVDYRLLARWHIDLATVVAGFFSTRHLIKHRQTVSGEDETALDVVALVQAGKARHTNGARDSVSSNLYRQMIVVFVRHYGSYSPGLNAVA